MSQLEEKDLTTCGLSAPATVACRSTVEHLIRINETRWLMAFLDGRLVSHFADGNLLAKLMMSPYEEEKDNEWARNERVNSKITVSASLL